MRRVLPYIAVGIIAAVITLYQPFVVFGADDFELVNNHKVFRYGFPFPIVECSEILPIHMSRSQIVLRLAGNFAVFFAGGLVVLRILRSVRARKPIAIS